MSKNRHIPENFSSCTSVLLNIILDTLAMSYSFRFVYLEMYFHLYEAGYFTVCLQTVFMHMGCLSLRRHTLDPCAGVEVK